MSEYDYLGAESVDTDPPVEPPDRFSKELLSPVAQKLYDQLVQQKDALSRTAPDAISKLYQELPGGISGDTQLAFMAKNLADTGLTDIYKVKAEQSVDRIPIQYGEVEAAGEGGGRDGFFYINPRGDLVEVAQRDIKGFDPGTPDRYVPIGGDQDELVPGKAPSGFIEKPKTTYINTETGEPLKNPQPDWVLSEPFGEQQNLLTGEFLGDRSTAAVGIEFSPDGTPIYFSQGYKRPSSFVKFRERVLEPVTAGIVGAYLGPAAAAAVRGLQTYHDTGDFGDAAKAAALSYAGSYAMGQLKAGLGSLDGASFDPSTAMETQLAAAPAVGDLGFLDTVNPAQLAAIESGLLPGEAGIEQILSGASPETGAITSPLGETLGDIPIDFGPDDYFGEPGVGELAGMMGPPEPAAAAEAAGAIEPTARIPDFSDLSGDYLGEPGIDELAEMSGPSGPPELGPDYYPEGSAPSEMLPEGEFDITDVVPPETPPEGEFDITDVVPPETPPAGTFDPASALETQIEPPMSNLDKFAAGLGAAGKALLGTPGGRLLLSTLMTTAAAKSGGGGGAGTAPVGWSGEIPTYQMVRERVPLADSGRRPGEYGRRYFSDTTYVPIESGEDAAAANLAAVQGAQQAAQTQAAGLAALPPGVEAQRARPVPTVKYQTEPTPATTMTGPSSAGLPAIPTYVQEPRLSYGLPTPDERLEATNFRTPEERRLRLAKGGLASLARGRYLDGPTDGMEDELRTTIEGKQPARLSHGEFVIPADVVSHLGNGNSQAGAQRLYEMMDKIRVARTGTKKQGKQINPSKYLPS